MNKKIHDILEEAGLAKGISAGETLVLMVLNNPSALHNFEKLLEEKVQSHIITEQEKNATMLQLENASEDNFAAQNKYLDSIDKKFEKIFLQYFSEEREKKKQELQDIESKLRSVLG